MSRELVKFYYSFRSPYAWLGFVRARAALPALGVEVRYIPVFPAPGNEPAVSANPLRRAYLREDVELHAKAYGLHVQWPETLDTDWVRPHACAVRADDLGRGEELIAAAFDARFGRGEDLGAEEVIASIAREAGLDADDLIAAADDADLQQRVWQGMREGGQDGVFGVPFFVLGEQHFWGNDRLEWLLRVIREQRGGAVSDLTGDHLAPVWVNPAGS